MSKAGFSDAADPALRIEKAVYGGDGLARGPAGQVKMIPFSLPGEMVQLSPAVSGQPEIVEASPDRVTPRCVHFGECGGCQYQMAGYQAQLRLKREILLETLARAGGSPPLPEVEVLGSPEPWGYRNRIRLRVRNEAGAQRLGYLRRGTAEFLPIEMCPIAAPVLWRAVEALVAWAARDAAVTAWLHAAAEVEVLCDGAEASLMVHLLCPGTVPGKRHSLQAVAATLQQAGLPVVSIVASRLHLPSGRATERLAFWGKEGLQYAVGDQRFWLGAGSFFQVNRFLLPAMVEQVCAGRGGALAWDLFAGVGLFARTLAEQFAAVTAVEANAAAATELRRALRRAGDTVVEATTLPFLRRAVTARERPELIVLDPPRAGAGEEACGLLRQLGPQTLVYVSCDPTTLARDLAVLAEDYHVAKLSMLDLFPQTYHLETVMVLERKAVAG